MLQNLLEDARQQGLPAELANIISHGHGSAYLQAIAEASLDSHFTDLLLPLYHPIAAEISQIWLASTADGLIEAEIIALASFARILPFATYLKPVVKDFLRGSHIIRAFESSLELQAELNHLTLQNLLLTLFRLLSVDLDSFIDLLKPIFLCSLFSHRSFPIRYLAIQLFCQVMRFADALNQDLVEKYIGECNIDGIWEGRQINFQVLELLEERRWIKMRDALDLASNDPFLSLDSHLRRFEITDLSSRIANVSGVLIPKRNHTHRPSRSTFVTTDTAAINLRSLATNLHHSKPILLSGPSGAGKTAVVREAARQLDKLSDMVTLHLNEQTDAKSLLGIYTSSPSGNGFVWQPGVLTNAVKEGRWVLIEDIDRIPAEVIGLLRPLIENAELFLPSRKEKLTPTDGFRILGTIKGTSAKTSNTVRDCFLSNSRLWNMTSVIEYPQTEIKHIIQRRHGVLEPFLDQIMAIHSRIMELYALNTAFKYLQGRKPTIRDLFKWCHRLASRLSSIYSPSIENVVPDTFMIEMLKECIDCYGSHFPERKLLYTTAANVGEILNIPPATLDHVVRNLNCMVQNGKDTFQVGRTILKKLKTGNRRLQHSSRFASTRLVRQNMEIIASAISAKEPLLLVGETGVGKTTIIQHMASSIGQDLTVVNLSNQSEASDLLGGLKPVTTRSLIVPLIDEFNNLFDATFSSGKNEKFQRSVSKAFAKQRWARLVGHWEEAIQLALKMLPNGSESNGNHEQTNKRRKLNESKLKTLRQKWTLFKEHVEQMQFHIQKGDQHQVFAFVESRLVKAVRDGNWLLLDEINLASPETLDNIVSLFHDGEDDVPYLLLAEAGNVQKIEAHPNFRIFAAMNPATDTGKKDLPIAIRIHFTELYVHAGDDDHNDLIEIIQTYLGTILDHDKKAASDLAKSYLSLKKLCSQNKLTDGAGDPPHFSLRSLTRCLLYVQQNAPIHNLRRAIYDGLLMSFFTVLDQKSQDIALPYIKQYLLNTPQSRKGLTTQKKDMAILQKYVYLQDYPILKGLQTQDRLQRHYIRTKSVDLNLASLARAASMRRFPVLLQGPTSAGKTSMVEYLAKYSGNRFVRINNHEHTDLQEYLGSYTSGPDGRLEYREGVLVEALRNGYWIVLDELNLAPSDVLEALNRLLDDNRELLIPESQEVVRPHPNFMLFATQNPAGIYGGRKRLSRAFRNRFLEIHVDDIPEDELQKILTERAQIPPSFCRQIVEVYKKLSLQRQSSRLFEQQNSFATLRDLFRWASRPFADREELAYHGYMLLAERVRNDTEKEVVKLAIEETLKVKIDDDLLYGLRKIPQTASSNSALTWTRAMRRLFVLVSAALHNNEPVLLVGETGCGKTQVCQAVAQALGRTLHIYNAHSNTETGDLIGSQRPVRHKTELAENLMQDLQSLGESYNSIRSNGNVGIEELIAQFKDMDTSTFENGAIERVNRSIAAYQSLFTWNDGSLVRAMKDGSLFLLDEISLADDSVLERMNSVLETARTILLAEKGAEDNFVVADPNFQFLATMNPGGDYGKRELSAALRNRLTEIWVPPLSDEEDVLPILRQRLSGCDESISRSMLDFARYFSTEFQHSGITAAPLRTLLKWTDFVKADANFGMDVALIHGAGMNFIDSLGANPAGFTNTTTNDIQHDREKCLKRLGELTGIDALRVYNTQIVLKFTLNRVQIGQFGITRLPGALNEEDLVLDVPTTLSNCMRIVRALQINRPILLEGSPGVGKTAIVSSLAKICGKSLARINLSDQTDLMDLFGADTPAENETVGNFVWRDGPMLKAMQTGGWVLLDEMNLASQSVLEGLNACLDHRQEIYIAELDRTFKCHPDFILFATQNPHHQGGGRKGLPASFVNRFTVVYADPLRQEDLVQICTFKHPSITKDSLSKIVSAFERSGNVVAQQHQFMSGAPWEFNLRDLSKLLTLCDQYKRVNYRKHFDTVIAQRFRNIESRNQIGTISGTLPGQTEKINPYHHISLNELQIGVAVMDRNTVQQTQSRPIRLANIMLPYAESVLLALKNNWPTILVGPSGCGKTTLIRYLAALSGARLVEFSMNADIDTADLIGGYEQYDSRRDLSNLLEEMKNLLQDRSAQSFHGGQLENQEEILETLFNIRNMNVYSETIVPMLSKCSRYVPEMQGLADRLQELQEGVLNKKNRFVWNDGILIDAIRSGLWLVLDNANLCNASILDRLNSLLEQNGCLIVSEQHSISGDAQVIYPHPNFRIILTVDPRYGELSRAMRNRSLEIFMDAECFEESQLSLPSYPLRSNMSRIRNLVQASSQHSPSMTDLEPWISQLSYQDILALSAPEELSQSLGYPGLLGKEVLLRKEQSHVQHHVTANLEAWRIEDTSVRKFLSDRTQPQLLLINEPRIRMLLDSNTIQTITSYARLQFLAIAVFRCQVALREAPQNGLNLTHEAPSALQISAAHFHARSRRNTGGSIPVFEFLSTFANFCDKILTYHSHGQMKNNQIRVINDVTALFFDMFTFLDQERIPEDQFQAYKLVGYNIAGELGVLSQDIAQEYRASVLATLGELWQMRTGLGLQRMWPYWKGESASSRAQLDSQLALEKLMEKFDGVGKCLPYPRQQLADLRSKLFNTRSDMLEGQNSSADIGTFETAIDELSKHQSLDPPILAHFASIYDRILPKLMLRNGYLNETELHKMVLFTSNLLTIEYDGILKLLTPISILRRLGVFASSAQNLEIAPGEISLDLLTKQLKTVDEQPLGNLTYAREEFSELIRIFSSKTLEISEDIHGQIDEYTVSLLRFALEPHVQQDQQKLTLRSTSGRVQDRRETRLLIERVQKSNAQTPSYLQDIVEQYLQPAIEILDQEQSTESGRPLLLVSMACLKLLVTDKIFDPSTYPRLIQSRYKQRLSALNSRLAAWKFFQRQTTDQDSSMLIRMLEEDIANLGEIPLAVSVYRPEGSYLTDLQAEYTNILRSVIDTEAMKDLVQSKRKSELELLKTDFAQLTNRVSACVRRLSSIHRAYDDLVTPVRGLLQCLYLGLILIRKDQESLRTSVDGPDENFLIPWNRKDLKFEALSSSSDSLTKLMTCLQYLQLHLAIETTSQPGKVEIISKMVIVIDQIYVQWKRQLSKDQDIAKAQSKYYTYRGQDKETEIDDQEVREMFPTFVEDEGTDELSDGSSNNDVHWQAMNVKVANFHQSIVKNEDAGELLRQFLRTGILSIPQDNSLKLDSIPGIMLIMQQKLKLFESKDAHLSLNIYVDGDISETRRLFDIVRSTQMRFRQISEAWPEHAVPTEALASCRYVLASKMNDPIAMLLTKTEKLLEIVAQWQVVASREWSVQALIDLLTQLLIHWRRLELGSWSKLLDVEDEKVRDMAHAWYFIAYEAVVYNSVLVVENLEEISEYCTSLAKTLEEFLSTTTLGQFTHRLQLLKVFSNTLSALEEKDNRLIRISYTVTNVVAHYARYEGYVTTRLKTDRIFLEKAIQEQIQMASWKDTNISALRDSARRSHYKLFKVVRKYRALLSEPITNLESNLENAPATTRMISLSPVIQNLDLTAHVLRCSTSLDGWVDRPERLRSPDIAAKTMKYAYDGAISDLEPFTTLRNYHSELRDAMKELRDTTPSTSTSDNASTVRNIKQRKRRLLAETMKELSQMGIRHNLGTAELKSQSSISQILSHVSTLDVCGLEDIKRADEAFNALLDVIPAAREGSLRHSEELTDGEVRRGLGYLEGFLHLVIKQRESIARNQKNFRQYEKTMYMVRTMQSQMKIAKVSSTEILNHDGNLRSQLAWISATMDIFKDILTFQGRHGGLHVSEITGSMERHRILLTEAMGNLDAMPQLPNQISSDSIAETYQQVIELVTMIDGDLAKWTEAFPQIQYLTGPLAKMLSMLKLSQIKPDRQTPNSLAEFDGDIQDILNSVFVLLQHMTDKLKSDSHPDIQPSWLTNATRIHTQAAAADLIGELVQKIDDVLARLSCIPDDEFQTAISLMILASPIVLEFEVIYKDLLFRQAETHIESCRFVTFLAKSFITLVRDGFCTPPEPSNQEEQSGKVEKGTGLGEGEAAEDISKDVGDDEDLSELAQKNGERPEGEDGIEKSKDAVDLGADDLEGEMGSGDEQASDDDDDDKRSHVSDEDDQDMDQETGSVDDLDPSAVDEKMWDELRKEMEQEQKEIKGQKSKGTESDNQTERQEDHNIDQPKDDVDAASEVDEEDKDQEDGREGDQRAEGEALDPHLDEETALELPEEMQLNGEEEKADDMSDLGMDELSDVDENHVADDHNPGDLSEEDEFQRDDNPSLDNVDDQRNENHAEEITLDTNADDGQQGDGDKEEQDKLATTQDEIMHDIEDQDGDDSGTAGTDQKKLDDAANETQPQGRSKSKSTMQASESQHGRQSEADGQGDGSDEAIEKGVGRHEETDQNQDTAIQRLADILDQYHRRREIFAASQNREEKSEDQDVDMAEADFEHLGEEMKENQTQALGTANTDVNQQFDESKAVEETGASAGDDLPMPDHEDENSEEELLESLTEKFSRVQNERIQQEQLPSRNAIIPESARERPRADLDQDTDYMTIDKDHVEIEHAEEYRHINHLASSNTTMSMADAQQLWSVASSRTQALSTMLTEQLRLILQPTTATKLRGDFRTGKRLNIRRIIPYIASGYKRDKIWMRRSVPSKRNYQIMLAVDDSKSMAESGADILALETLCMLSRSLSMLEVGELSIVAFGQDYSSTTATNNENITNDTNAPSAPNAVKVAHPFSQSFSPNQSGPMTFSNFSFSQTGTNIRALLAQSISLFADARAKSSARDAADLWQLQLIISDGHIGSDSDDSVRRLVRKAREAKIMCVFVVVDSGEESIVDLKEVSFDEESGEVTTRRYLENFPFQYYVVVREVRDLPGVLSRVLKGWFEGVVEQG